MNGHQTGAGIGSMRIVATALACFLALTPGARADAGPPVIVPTSLLGGPEAVGMAEGSSTVYLATGSGLYRSASSAYAAWIRVSTIPDIKVISPNPSNPTDLIYVRGTGHSRGDRTSLGDGIYHSTDGGHSATRMTRCTPDSIARSPSSPTVLYAAAVALGGCFPPTPDGYVVGGVLRSTNDGMTWATSATLPSDYYNDPRDGFDAITVDPANPDHVLMGRIHGHEEGQTWGSDNGGRAWRISADSFGYPENFVFYPRRPAEVWALWGVSNESGGVYRSVDGGRSWQDMSSYLPLAPGKLTVPEAHPQWVRDMELDPMSGRLYLSEPPPFGANPRLYDAKIYATLDGVHYEQFGARRDDLSRQFRITANGYILTWHGARPLRVIALIGAGNWNVSAALNSRAARPDLRVLGLPLSPTDRCAGRPCQYFVKGALAAQGPSAVRFVALVPRLLGAREDLPVGGSASSVTYATLARLHPDRTPPPPGFRHGTAAVHGGTFIPYSPTLAARPGYVVPPYFWRYLNDPATAPDGWQHALGLPLTPAVRAVVSKGKLGRRAITIQAFQDAVLTYDPQNPAPFRVERANAGADFAAAFPAAVR